MKILRSIYTKLFLFVSGLFAFTSPVFAQHIPETAPTSSATLVSTFWSFITSGEGIAIAVIAAIAVVAGFRFIGRFIPG